MKTIKNIQCPCCKQRKNPTKIKKTIQLFPFDGAFRAVDDSWPKTFMEIINRYSSFYNWACDTCIREGKAILANPKKQFHTFKSPMDAATPFLAYFDKNQTCQKCKTHYIFSKEEQQFWYEKLQFVVYAKPIHCPTCRKEIRQKKQLNTQLSKLFKDGQPTTAAELTQVAEIYKEFGIIEKWKGYLTLARKANRNKSNF